MPGGRAVQQAPVTAAADQRQAVEESSGRRRRSGWSFAARHGISGKFKAFRKDMKKEDTSIQQMKDEAKRPAVPGIGSMNTATQRFYGTLKTRAFQADMIRQKYRIGGFTIDERDYSGDSLTDAPVFETHAAFETDKMGDQHCFIGMRYTVYDPTQAKEGQPLSGYKRKRVVIGFGAGGNTIKDALGKNGNSSEYGEADQAVSVRTSKPGITHGVIEEHCKLMNDVEHASSVSSQTPVTKDKIIAVFDAIPKFISTFNYNVLLANCNDFARTMAKIAGVSAGELHEALTGPMGAKDNLLNAGGKEGATQIYYAGNMASANREYIEKLLESALKDVEKNRGLQTAKAKLQQVSQVYRQEISHIWWSEYHLDSKQEELDLKGMSDELDARKQWLDNQDESTRQEIYIKNMQNELKGHQDNQMKRIMIVPYLQFCSEHLGEALVSGNGELNEKIIRLRKWTDDTWRGILNGSWAGVDTKIEEINNKLADYKKKIENRKKQESEEKQIKNTTTQKQ